MDNTYENTGTSGFENTGNVNPGSKPTGSAAAHTDRYLNRMSATFAALAKLLEGLGAAALIGLILYPAWKSAGSLAKLPAALQEYIDTILSLPDLLSGTAVAGSMLIFSVAWGIFVLIGIAVFMIILALIDGFASVSLRFTGKGAGVIRKIHLIYAIEAGLYLVYTVVDFIYYHFFVKDAAVQTLSAAGQAANAAAGAAGNTAAGSALQSAGAAASATASLTEAITPNVIMATIVTIIILLIEVCYHKDIAKAMTTVEYETKNGLIDPEFKKTHLSGLSFLLGLPWLFPAFLCVLVLVGGIQGAVTNTPITADGKVTSAILLYLVTAWILIFVLKQFAICFCYRNMKRAR